jgi:hypothetical protein
VSASSGAGAMSCGPLPSGTRNSVQPAATSARLAKANRSSSVSRMSVVMAAPLPSRLSGLSPRSTTRTWEAGAAPGSVATRTGGWSSGRGFPPGWRDRRLWVAGTGTKPCETARWPARSLGTPAPRRRGGWAGARRQDFPGVGDRPDGSVDPRPAGRVADSQPTNSTKRDKCDYLAINYKQYCITFV